MGRGRVELKKIENKISRQVTFSKRRSGLLKKAREISLLCDATVALFVFSTKGKLCEFASDSSCMEKILERYEQYSQAERDLTTTPDPNSHGSLTMEHAKLKAKLDILHKNHRNYMGEELDTLSCKELHNVEHRLDIALKHIRSKKNQLMYESISELQKKEKALEENNNDLSKKMKEKQNTKEKEKAINQQAQCDQQNHILNSSSFFASQVLPSLNMRGSYESGGSVVEDEATQSQHRGNSSTIMPAWMLSHIANQ